MDKPYLFIPDLPELGSDIPEDSILSRTVHEDDRLKVILFSFAENQELSEHTASQPAILHFLQGECDIQLGGDQVQGCPGTWVYMPARLNHSIRARTPTLMLLLLYQP